MFLSASIVQCSPTLVSQVWKQNVFGNVAVTQYTAGTPPREGCAIRESLLSHTTFCHETWLTLRTGTVGTALPAWESAVGAGGVGLLGAFLQLWAVAVKALPWRCLKAMGGTRTRQVGSWPRPPDSFSLSSSILSTTSAVLPLRCPEPRCSASPLGGYSSSLLSCEHPACSSQTSLSRALSLQTPGAVVGRASPQPLRPYRERDPRPQTWEAGMGTVHLPGAP